MRYLIILSLFFIIGCDNQKKDRPSEKDVTFLKCSYSEYDNAKYQGLNYLKIADILMFKDSDMYATTLSIYEDATFTRKKQSGSGGGTLGLAPTNFANTLSYYSEKYLVFNIVTGDKNPPQFILNRFTLTPTYLQNSNRVSTDSKDKENSDRIIDEKLKGIIGKSEPFINRCEKITPLKKQI